MYWKQINILFLLSLCKGKCYEEQNCDVRMRLESGRICGEIRTAEDGTSYASFRGIPYATQPVGKLRFEELKPVEPWYHLLDATREGPVCPQHDIVWEHLMAPHQGMSEACIYANVYVPLTGLPKFGRHEPNYFYNEEEIGYDQNRELEEHNYTYNEYRHRPKHGLPILVYVYGGGFLAGSGDSDIYGPENLMTKDVILMTFNYRLNVFGFLSLNNPKIPGNQGLRDIMTFLNWVQKNARAFGGDPDNVTLMGQSAGAVNAQLVALSKYSEGLFKRLILLSGVAELNFYTSSPIYAKLVATLFLNQLGINSTDPDVIHDQLVNLPLETIMRANSVTQFITGLVSFVPVVETPFAGVKRIVDDNPVQLFKRGRDKKYPLIIGFTSDECEFFKGRLEDINFISRLKANPLLILRPGIPFETPPNVAFELSKKVMDRYFHGEPELDKYLKACTDVFFKYPSFKFSEWRASIKGAAPVYLYQFSYEADYNLVQKGKLLKYKGAAHVEDLTYVFRTNSFLGKDGYRPLRDEMMKDWMTNFVINFMECNNPTCTALHESPWPAVKERVLNYQHIYAPGVYSNSGPTEDQHDMIHFFDMIEARSRNASLQGLISEEALDLPGLISNMSSAVDGAGRISYYVDVRHKHY